MKDVLEKAIELEEEGRRFYDEASQRAKNKAAKLIFDELAKEETTHKETIYRIYEDLRAGKAFNEWIITTKEERVLSVFQKDLVEELGSIADDIEALKVGLGIEQKSIKYYEGLAESASSNFERRFFLTLSYEERGHYLRILDTIEFLSNPEAFFLLKEKSMRDAG